MSTIAVSRRGRAGGLLIIIGVVMLIAAGLTFSFAAPAGASGGDIILDSHNDYGGTTTTTTVHCEDDYGWYKVNGHGSWQYGWHWWWSNQSESDNSQSGRCSSQTTTTSTTTTTVPGTCYDYQSPYSGNWYYWYGPYPITGDNFLDLYYAGALTRGECPEVTTTTTTSTTTTTLPGTITIKKLTLPDTDNSTEFDFSGDLGVFHLTGNNDSQDFNGLTPGPYDVTEGDESGWRLTGLECDDDDSQTGEATATIEVAAGEHVTCTFTNTQDGRIEIEKQTLPDGHSASFPFTGDINTSLMDGESAGADVAPGTYSVEEGATADFELYSIVCDDGASASPSSGAGSTATFHVEPGETVRCVFTNEEDTVEVCVPNVGAPGFTIQEFYLSEVPDGAFLPGQPGNYCENPTTTTTSTTTTTTSTTTTVPEETTTTTSGSTTTTSGATTTTSGSTTTEATTTTAGGSTTSSTVVGGPCDPNDPGCLPFTGGSEGNLLSLMLAGIGLLMLGAGFVVLADERRRLIRA